MCIDSMRISGIQILSQGKIMMTIFGVYLPYNGVPEQIQHYAETCDLKALSYHGVSPERKQTYAKYRKYAGVR